MNLSLDFIPASKKNNTEIRKNWKSGRNYISPNKRVEKEEVRIKGIARALRAEGGTKLRELSKPEIPLEHDVSMTVVLHIGKKPGEDSTSVTVKDLGIPPKRKRTGRIRDAINTPAIIADALQGVCYDDDKQIVELTVRVEHE